MRTTLRHIYLCRTANKSWRTCVVVKQIQSNPIQPTVWSCGIHLRAITQECSRCRYHKYQTIIDIRLLMHYSFISFDISSVGPADTCASLDWKFHLTLLDANTAPVVCTVLIMKSYIYVSKTLNDSIYVYADHTELFKNAAKFCVSSWHSEI